MFELDYSYETVKAKKDKKGNKKNEIVVLFSLN